MTEIFLEKQNRFQKQLDLSVEWTVAYVIDLPKITQHTSACFRSLYNAALILLE